MRKETEKIKDKFLLLFQIYSVFKYGEIEGALKLQKLTFLSEWELAKKKIKAFHFKFFRYQLGPFSKDLYVDSDELKSDNFISSYYSLKDKAKHLLSYTIEPIRQYRGNGVILDTIDEVCKQYSQYSGRELMRRVYDMKIIPHDISNKEMKIKEIPTFYDILVPEHDSSLKDSFNIQSALCERMKKEFDVKKIGPQREKQLMRETEDRLIDLIKTKIHPSEKVNFINELKEGGASRKILSKFMN